MSRPRIGSLFSGYGGLDMGVQSVLGGDVAWHVEFDTAPSKILAHHWPTVPNYGDITTVDWTQVEPVDILTGGFPCQDVSLAGRRAGMKQGTRSGLWTEYARAINQLRPGLVVIENVRGLLSAEAHSDLEPCTWCVGDGTDQPVLRALGAVLGDLSDLGYDAEWCGVRAADAGAPHGRFRVFIVAYPRGGRDRWGAVAPGRRQGARTNAAPDGADSGAHRAPDADSSSESGSIGHGNDVRAWSGTIERVSDAGGSATADPEYVVGYGTGRAWHGRAELADNGCATANARSDEPKRRGIAGHLGSTPAEGYGEGDQRQRVRDTARDSSSAVAWGDYEPAIRRWERATGRIAPAPTDADGKNGQHRLSARFVEWMQGLPAGHVTDPIIGLTRNEQLKALGNGVVPQQAELALRYLLAQQLERAA